MPNWADCEMSVVLPSKNADKFENLFLERDSENNKEKERYFARCFVSNIIQREKPTNMV